MTPGDKLRFCTGDCRALLRNQLVFILATGKVMGRFRKDELTPSQLVRQSDCGTVQFKWEGIAPMPANLCRLHNGSHQLHAIMMGYLLPA